MGKKIYISERQFNEFVNPKNKKNNSDYIKADRKGRRESDRELYGDGFKSMHKVHKSQKNYSRKGKNKFSNDFSDEDYD